MCAWVICIFHSFSKFRCTYEAAKWSCGERVCKTQITTLSCSDLSQKNPKQQYCFQQNRCINIYIVNCLTAGGSEGRGGPDDIRCPGILFAWSVSGKSHLWTFGVQVLSACYISLLCTWISIYATAGGVQLGGSHSLTLTSKASVQHVQVVSHLYVCKKFRVEGSFHILRNPAVDRWFKYVLRKKTSSLGSFFTLFLTSC